MNSVFKGFFLFLLIFILACSSSKKTASPRKVFTDEQIETDAYAKANLDCTYELARIKAVANKKDKKLEGISYNLLLQQRDFNQKVKYSYLKDSIYKHKYQNYYKKATKFFKTCKQLEAIKNEEKK